MKKSVMSVLALTAIILSGCSTTVYISTKPSDAKVYVNDELMGKTPYKTSISNFIFNSYSVRLVKPGYKTVDTSFAREIKPEAIVCGVCCIIPLLWCYGPVSPGVYELHTKGVDDYAHDLLTEKYESELFGISFSSLVNMGKPAIPGLIELLHTYNTMPQCGYIALVLGDIETQDTIPLLNSYPSLQTDAIVPLLSMIKTSRNADVISKASKGVWKLGGNKGISQLGSILSSGKRSECARAVFALGEIGTPAKNMIPQIISLPRTIIPLEKFSLYKLLRNSSDEIQISNPSPSSNSVASFYDRQEALAKQARIIRERWENSVRYGYSFSQTEDADNMSRISTYISNSISNKLREMARENKRKELITQQFKEMETDALQLQYKNYIHVDTSDVRISDYNTFEGYTIVTNTKFTINPVEYAIEKINGRTIIDENNILLK